LEETIDLDDSYDFGTLRLAVKLGMVGVILEILLSLVTESFWFVQIETNIPLSEFSHLLSIMSAFGFVASILASVGFVGIFAMKRSNLGIVFLLMVYASYIGYPLFLRVVFEAGLGSSELHISSSYVLGFSLALLGGIALLSLRNVSKNSHFLTGFAVLYMTKLLIASLIFMLAFGGPVQIESGLDHIIASLPNLTMSMIISVMTLFFFMIEGK
jgi:hypothetical protein